MDPELATHPMIKDAPLPFELPEWIALAPFEEYLSMSIVNAADGAAELVMPFFASHCQGLGLMHGGAIVALADTALAMAIKSTLPAGTHFATTSMSMEFHAPVRWGTVRASARIVERIERDIQGEVNVYTEEGIKAATFRATFRMKRDSRIA